MDNSPPAFHYTEIVELLEETVHHDEVDIENFDFDLFNTFVETNPDLKAVPTVLTSSYDGAENGAVPEDEWDKEKSYTAPNPAPSPIRSSLPQVEIQVSIPYSATLDTVLNNAPRAYPVQQREQREGTEYLNLILNSFSDPSYPLKIIDRLQYPFSQALQAALERECALQLLPFLPEDIWSQGYQGYQAEPSRPVDNSLPDLSQAFMHAQQYPIPLVQASSPSPEPSIAESSTTKKAGNKRPANIKNFNSRDFYSPLPHIPLSWGAGPYPGELLFHYTPLGELNPTSTYTARDIIKYIQFHPLNTYNNKLSGLTMWIQVTPADSGKRYGSQKSEKCRFECCPDPQRTIRKGDFRIAFDEQHSQGLNTDPFHNAGYVHLYCMEKFVDFPSICRVYNVRPDTRKLKEGKNKMAITRDHPSMQAIALNFIRTARPWLEFGGGVRPEEYYEHTLCYQLTIEHLKRQPRHLQKIREKRGGNSIDTHLNNLDKYLAGRKELESQRKAGLRPGFGTRGPKKRKAAGGDGTLNKDGVEISGEDWDGVLDNKILEGKTVGQEQDSLRKIKKLRRG